MIKEIVLSFLILSFSSSFADSKITKFDNAHYTFDDASNKTPLQIAQSLIKKQETRIQEFKDPEEVKIEPSPVKIKEIEYIVHKKTSKVAHNRIRRKPKKTVKLIDYISIGVGMTRPKIASTFTQSTTNLAQVHVIALGKNITDFIALEFATNYSPEYYQKSTVALGRAEYTSIFTSIIGFVNGYIHFLSLDNYYISPFIVGGVGLSYNSSHSFSSQTPLTSNLITNVEMLERKDRLDLAVQFGVGLTFKLNDNINFSMSYRYIDRGNFTTALFGKANTIITNHISEHATIGKLIVSF